MLVAFFSGSKMDKDGDYLSPPAEFPFPFLPYSIQSDFMTSLYQAIEQKKIGIFESPTGVVHVDLTLNLIMCICDV